MKRPYKRRNIFIKKDFQGKYIFTYFIFVIIGSTLFTVIFSFFSADTLSIVYENFNLQVGTTPEILLKKILNAHWVFIVFGGFLVVVVSMFLTHRVAGPMYRFEKTLDEMITGNIGYIVRLRNKDEGKEFSKKLNQFNRMLSLKVKEMNSLVDEIDGSLFTLVETTDAGKEIKDVASELDYARALNARLKEALGFFKLNLD